MVGSWKQTLDGDVCAEGFRGHVLGDREASDDLTGISRAAQSFRVVLHIEAGARLSYLLYQPLMEEERVTLRGAALSS